MPTSIHPKAKPDTVLLLDPQLADGFVDHSQHRTELDDNGTYFSESNSARTALNSRREIFLSWDITSGETGVLIEHSNVGGYTYRVRIASGNVVECHENGSLVVSAAIQGLTASDRRVDILWSQHPEGANVRSELFVYTPAAVAVVIAQATHAATATSATDTLTVGASFGGASGFSGGLDFYYVRIGRRFHSQTEMREDWITTTTQPSTTQTRRAAPLVPDRETLDIADDGSFVGPDLLWSGHAFEQADRRLVGSLLNVRVLDPLQVTSDYDTPNTAWWRTAPGDEDMHMCIAHLFYRPVPGKVNRAHARLHIRQNNPVGSATAEVRYRVYSISGLPVAGEPVGPLVYYRTAQGTCSTDHGTTLSAGQWLNLGELALAVDDWGHTWIAVAISMDESSMHIANTQAYVHAITLDPYHEPSGDGGLDFIDP